MISTAMEKWVRQARELGLDRPEAMARSARLLHELDAYLVRRRNWPRLSKCFQGKKAPGRGQLPKSAGPM